jgi:hypothetical protein
MMNKTAMYIPTTIGVSLNRAMFCKSLVHRNRIICINALQLPRQSNLRCRRHFTHSSTLHHRMQDIPDIKTFLRNQQSVLGSRNPREVAGNETILEPYMHEEERVDETGNEASLSSVLLRDRRFFIETYGCQMNASDSEIVHAVLEGAGMSAAATADQADVVLINTCAVYYVLGYFDSLFSVCLPCLSPFRLLAFFFSFCPSVYPATIFSFLSIRRSHSFVLPLYA